MGTVKVTVQTEKRLEAINNLSRAIRAVAEALDSGTRVEISHNTFSNLPIGVQVDTADKVNETLIEKIPDPE